MSNELTFEEITSQGSELLDLQYDYSVLEKQYFQVCEFLAIAEAKLAKPNKQLKMEKDKSASLETYICAYEEFYGELPKTLHLALLLVTSQHYRSADDRNARARDLANVHKKSVSFVTRMKEKFNAI